MDAKNIQALKDSGCNPTESSFNGKEMIKVNKKNLSNLPNRQVILLFADLKACPTEIGSAADIAFPQDWIAASQIAKIKFDMKSEIDKFDAANSKESINYIVGYESKIEFEAAFMNAGTWKDFIDKKILGMPIGAKGNMATLMLYGVSNPKIDSDWKMTGDGIEAFLRVGPLEAGEIIATGDAKKMSVTKFTQLTAMDSKKVVIPNTNGQFDNLIEAMFGIKDINDGIWDNNNPNKLLK